jgi:hypothetical protein
MQRYQAPTITELGSVLELTQGGSVNRVLDADFPADTPLSDLTTS